MNNDDYNNDIKDEVEVLKAIFLEDFEECDPVWNSLSFKITVKNEGSTCPTSISGISVESVLFIFYYYVALFMCSEVCLNSFISKGIA